VYLETTATAKYHAREIERIMHDRWIWKHGGQAVHKKVTSLTKCVLSNYPKGFFTFDTY